MVEFKRCKRCLMPTTRPGLELNEDGICYPCVYFEIKKEIDWEKRYHELLTLCLGFLKTNNSYNCLITVSGGKDSMRQVGLFKEELKMNPLCLMIDNFSWTKIGRKNYYNLSERFGVDLLCFTPNRKYMKRRIKQDFINELWPAKLWDEYLYRIPHEYAKKFGINLVIWGENPGLEKGGFNLEDPGNAIKQTPDYKDFEGITSIFTDYFIPWSRYFNAGYSIVNGLRTLDNHWERAGLEHFPFEQVDTIGYLINAYSKFIKFGFGNQTELCSDAIRYGIITREEGLRRIKKYDWKVDKEMVLDFCKGIDIDIKTFWSIIDKHANKYLLYYDDNDGFWKLKEEFLK